MPMRVLVIDDHPMCRAAVRIALTSIDADTETVEVAFLADALAADGPFDLVVLDLNLPDSRGIPTLVDVASKFPAPPLWLLAEAKMLGGKTI